LRTHAVLLRCATTTFTLRLGDKGASRRLARRLEARLREWRNGTAAPADPSTAVLPPPQLPEVTLSLPSRAAMIWVVVKTTVLMFIGGAILGYLVLSYRGAAVVPITASLLYVAVAMPELLRKKPRPAVKLDAQEDVEEVGGLAEIGR
jgi:hypothetical protein